MEDLKKQYNISYNLYDLAFSYQNARTNNAISDIKIHTNWFFNNNCSDSLQIHFYDLDDTGIINIYYDYKISKFSQQEIEVLHSRIINMAIQVLDNSSILLEDISIIDDSEKQFIDNISGNIKIGHPRNV